MPPSSPHTYQGNVSYPISKLPSPDISYIDYNSLIELAVRDIDGNYVSRSTTIQDFGDFIISAHPIFNNLYDVFYTDPDVIWFGKETRFNSRPKIENSVLNNVPITSSACAPGHLITKADLAFWINKHGIAIDAVGPNSVYYLYDTSNPPAQWKKADPEDWPVAIANDIATTPIYSTKSAVKFNTAPNGSFTYPVEMDCHAMLHIVGNLVLAESYSSITSENNPNYYNTNYKRWIGVYYQDIDWDDYDNEITVNRLITTMPLTNIFKFGTGDSAKAVAQFSIDVPVKAGAKISLYSPADIMDSSGIDESALTRSLYSKLNCCSLSYYRNELSI